MNSQRRTELSKKLEELYAKFNKRAYVDPDPLVFLYEYKEPGDREIVALVASSLAYGRVAQILKSVHKILAVLGPSPKAFLLSTPKAEVDEALEGFKHRFSSGHEISTLLAGAKAAIEKHGSLEKCFLYGFSKNDVNVLPALEKFSAALCKDFPKGGSYLVPTPERGSACKRVNLMLRWLIRQDDVDPGGWQGVPAAKLLVPLDTHMFSVAKSLGLTNRNSANLLTAAEITKGFAEISPDDPVRYDFSLTRAGINPEVRKSGDGVIK